MDAETVIRDWIHETPLSLCNASADECPDWGIAIALAEAIKERNGPFYEIACIELRHRTRETMAYLDECARKRAPRKRRWWQRGNRDG